VGSILVKTANYAWKCDTQPTSIDCSLVQYPRAQVGNIGQFEIQPSAEWWNRYAEVQRIDQPHSRTDSAKIMISETVPLAWRVGQTIVIGQRPKCPWGDRKGLVDEGALRGGIHDMLNPIKDLVMILNVNGHFAGINRPNQLFRGCFLRSAKQEF
jgi:hypothetical protein